MQNIKEFKIPNAIQSRENSKNGGIDDILHIGSVWQNPNGNRNVPYLNRNGAKRNLNLNWIENDWSGIYRFAAVRKSFHFPARLRRVYFKDFIHPPSIFPISSNLSESKIYFLLSKDFISHATCKKNFSKSNFREASLREISFLNLSE